MTMRIRKWTAVLLIAAMALLQGCSAPAGSADPAEGGGMASAGNSSGTGTEKDTGPQSMGRYLEQEVTLPEMLTASSSPQTVMQTLDDGSVAVLEYKGGLYVTSDSGENWTAKETPWLSDLNKQEAYIANIALAPNGAAAVIYVPHDEEEESEEDAGSYNPQYLYVSPDGTAKELAFSEGDQYLHSLWFGRDSRLYAGQMGGRYYELDPENGSAQMLFEMSGLDDYVCFTDQYIIVIGSSGVTTYDMEAQEVLPEDEVLSDFLIEATGNNIGANSDAHSVVAVEGESADVIYFAVNGGLYRHAVGGEAIEQVIDGSLSSLGNPSMALMGMSMLPDTQFMVLYSQAKLMHYTYDPSAPTVPESQITVYSLLDQRLIRQAVSLYQKSHPDVYVRYETGMNGEGGLTAEDAIRNLNTKMMSGTGPDLLVLDHLPYQSYQEKGILMDMSGTIDSLGGDGSLLRNIVDAFREGDGIYMLPLRFRLPLLVGNAAALQNVKDLKTLADAAESLRSQEPQGAILGFLSPEGLLRALARSCSAAWTKEDGSIDTAALTEFLTQAKRIWDAETAGVSEEEKRGYERNLAWWLNQTNNGMSEDNYGFLTSSSGATGVAMGERKLTIVETGRVDFDFNIMTTLAGQEENFGYSSWSGQVEDGFFPTTLVGVCANTENPEAATEFYQFLFSREVQDPDGVGFPINQASFESRRENPRPEQDSAGGLALSDEAGNIFGLDLKWITEEGFQWLRAQAGAAKTPCIGSSALEQAVYEIGVRALDGSRSVEETVTEIEKKAAIYMAE